MVGRGLNGEEHGRGHGAGPEWHRQAKPGDSDGSIEVLQICRPPAPTAGRRHAQGLPRRTQRRVRHSTLMWRTATARRLPMRPRTCILHCPCPASLQTRPLACSTAAPAWRPTPPATPLGRRLPGTTRAACPARASGRRQQQVACLGDGGCPRSRGSATPHSGSRRGRLRTCRPCGPSGTTGVAAAAQPPQADSLA